MSRDLTLRHGKGFSRSNVIRIRQFYLAYPKGATASHLLSWSHWVELLKLDGPLERSFCHPEAHASMSNTKSTAITVHGTTVSVLSGRDGDYISITDMLKAKDGDFFVADWLRNRNTVEFLGIWESVFNPDFNHGAFATIKSQVGLNSYKLSVKEWSDANLGLDGNLRDHATIEQLLVLANIEGMNAEFIHMGLAQGDRLQRLNEIAIRQMQVLTSASAIKQLKG